MKQIVNLIKKIFNQTDLVAVKELNHRQIQFMIEKYGDCEIFVGFYENWKSSKKRYNVKKPCDLYHASKTPYVQIKKKGFTVYGAPCFVDTFR